MSLPGPREGPRSARARKKKKKIPESRLLGSAKLDGWHTHTHIRTHFRCIYYIFCTGSFSPFFFFSPPRRHVTSTGRRSRERNERNGVLRLHISSFLFFCCPFGKRVKVSRDLQCVFSSLSSRPGRAPGGRREPRSLFFLFFLSTATHRRPLSIM